LAGDGRVPGMVGQELSVLRLATPAGATDPLLSHGRQSRERGRGGGSMTPRIGFVRPPGPMGDGIRYAAVLQYLQRSFGNVVDMPLRADPNDERGSDRWRAVLASRPWQWGRGSHASLSDTRRILQCLRDYRHAVCAGEALARRNDLDLLHAETHMAAVACWAAKRKRGWGYVYDMHGLVPEERAGAGDPAPVVSLTDRWERRVAADAHHIIVVSQGMRQFVARKYGIPVERITVARNGTSQAPSIAEFRKPIRLVYGGVFAYWERVDLFLELARLLGRQEFEFHLIGDGPLRNALLDQINRDGLDVVYHGKKSRQRTLELFSAMQVGIAPSSTDVVRQTASPIKVLDYAACGLPIVTPDVGEWTSDLRTSGAAVVVPENTAAALAAGVASLTDRETWARTSMAARAMISNGHTWEQVLAPLSEIYD
jgi:glycosyltransferase involved in cell wall biosynthesis